MHRRRLVCGGVLAFGLVVLGACSTNHSCVPVPPAGSSDPTLGSGPATSAAPATSPVTTPIPRAAEGETLVATVNPAGAPDSPMPGSGTTVKVPGQWLGATSVLPVIAQRPGWVEVRLAHGMLMSMREDVITFGSGKWSTAFRR